MDFMRSWIISITVSAMIIALAEGLMPAGTVKKVGKLTGGLVLMLGILQPIVRMDYEELFLVANGLESITVESQVQLQEDNNAMLKSIIEEEVAAYVLDKAQNLGCTIRVSVTCAVEGTELYPAKVQIRGKLTPQQQGELAKVLQADLGIDRKSVV